MTDTEYRWVTPEGVILADETYRDGVLINHAQAKDLTPADLQQPGVKKQYRYLPSPVWSDVQH